MNYGYPLLRYETEPYRNQYKILFYDDCSEYRGLLFCTGEKPSNITLYTDIYN